MEKLEKSFFLPDATFVQVDMEQSILVCWEKELFWTICILLLKTYKHNYAWWKI